MKSVVEYFRETYGFATSNTPSGPVCKLEISKRPNYLPMEVCKIAEGRRYSKRLNERQITALLKVTCQRPQDREHDILKIVNHNAYAQDPCAQEFGIKISEKLASVEACIMPAPWLKYHETSREEDCLPQVGQWNMMNKLLFIALLKVLHLPYRGFVRYGGGVQRRLLWRVTHKYWLLKPEENTKSESTLYRQAP